MRENLWILFACIIFATIISSNELYKQNSQIEGNDSTSYEVTSSIDFDLPTRQASPDSVYRKANRHDRLFQQLAREQNIDWMWLKAVMIAESHGNHSFISTTGAVGLMQLMPREGSFFDKNYRNYQAARKETRQKDGLRYFNGQSELYWASAYRKVLDSLQNSLSGDELYQKDLRFDPEWNITDASRQFASDYQFFQKRGHNAYKSRILAFAAYNAGRYAVMKERENISLDRIPVNGQTELYVAHVERIFQELKKHKGQINAENDWVMKL